MTDYGRLKNKLAITPFLVADGATGQVSLVDQETAFDLMSEAGLFHSQVIMNAGKALDNFAQLAGKGDRVFSLREIATITGTPYSQAYGWLSEKVITPSVRPASGSGRGKEPQFSWQDAFVAGICGSLRRNGVRLELLRNVSPLFDTKKKRTAKRAATRSRS